MVSRPAARQADLPWLRGIAWALILAGALGAVLVATVALWPPDYGCSRVAAEVQRWDGPPSQARLYFRDGRWTGSMDDFPPGSTTRFQPRELPGFFLVRFSDGSFLAMADRSPHIGHRVEWRNPRPGSDMSSPAPTGGFYDGDTIFFADGFPETGPAPRPLDAFPVTVENRHLYFAPHAHCSSIGYNGRWCDRRIGSPEPPDRCSKLFPEYCWSFSRCRTSDALYMFCRLPG